MPEEGLARFPPERPASSAETAPGRLVSADETTWRKPKNKYYGKLAKEGVIWSVFRAGAVEAVATPTAMVLARLLTPFDFGLSASVTFFTQLAAKLTNLGFNQALVRLKAITEEHCAFVFVADLIAGIASYLVLVSASSMIGAFFRAPQIAEVMPVVALTFLIGPFGTVSAALMNRDMEFRKAATAAWVGGLSEAAVCLGLAFAGFGFWSIVYGRVAGQIGVTGAKMMLRRWRPSVRFTRQAVKDLFAFGTGVFAKRLLDYGANNLDNLVVARTLGLVPLGFYDKAFIAMNKVLVRLNSGGPTVSFRIFSLIHEEGDRFRRAYAKVVLAATLFTYPVFAGLAAAGTELIEVLFGPRWDAAVMPFQILCAAGALKVVNEYAGSAAQAWGRIWGQVWIQLAYNGLVVVCVAGFSRFGLPGAAFGVLVATLVMSVLMSALLMRTAMIRLPAIMRPQLPGMSAAVIVAGTVIVIRQVLNSSLGMTAAWQVLPVQAFVAASLYLGFLKFCPLPDVRDLVRETADDLPSALRRLARFLA